MKNRKMYISIFWILLGAVLLGCNAAGVVDNFWVGMGTGVLLAGIAQLIRNIRYFRDPEYREKVDITEKDERNRYISGKAWAWAGYFYVLTAAVASIVLRVMGKSELASAACYSLCFLIVLRWIVYVILQKKY